MASLYDEAFTNKRRQNSAEEAFLRSQRNAGISPAITPSLPPPDWRSWLMKPAGDLSPQNAGVWDLSGAGRGMGNIPRAAINNSPIPLLARGLSSLGEAEHKAADWAFFTPEGEWVNRAAPAANPSPAPAPNYVLPQSGGLGTAQPPASASLPSGGGGGVLPANAVAMAQELQSRGYNPVQIAGILGNAQAESNFSPTVNEVGGDSYGAFQWRGPRLDALRNWAAQNQLNPDDSAVQARFADQELHSTEGYAMQQLQAARTPEEAAAAMLHFERPQGYSRAPGQFNPSAVSGWNNRASAADSIYAQLNGQPLPPQVEAFQQGAPPAVPNPIDRPLPNAPDFAEQDSWLNRAAPQASDPALMQKLARDRLLSGIAQANAGVDVRGPGAAGRLFAAWGSGASQANEANDLATLSDQQRFQQQQQEFALRRAGVAAQQSEAETAWKNAAGDTQYQNRSDEQKAGWADTQQVFQTDEANRKAGFDAEQANRKNIYDWQQQAWTNLKPKVLDTSDKGVTIQNPDGSIVHQNYDRLDALSLATQKNLPGPLAAIGKYGALAQMGDQQSFKTEIIRDLVASGQASSVFGQAYQEALKTAQDSIDPTIRGDARVYQKALSDALSAQLIVLLQGNDGWIPNAAAMGNIGARMLVSGQQAPQ